MNLNEIKYAYFLGIGGIGMSAIARFLNSRGVKVAGYDKTTSELTDELIAEGIEITFEDRPQTIPGFVHAFENQTLIVYTPAIPKDHQQYLTLIGAGRKLYKRSEVLGIISRDSFTIAVAGTHGKTTTSTMIAHLLYECNINFTAFLGGISANYNTNYINKVDGRNLLADKSIVVVEADEFDRSFHRLSPDIAVITAIDPDHLDIYNTAEEFYEAFQVFASKIKPGGTLIYNHKLKNNWPAGPETLTYGRNPDISVNFESTFKTIRDGQFIFGYNAFLQTYQGPVAREITEATCGLPGFHNIENATAALAISLDILNLDEKKVLSGLANFKGAKRRFEYIIKNQDFVVIDDYAHHPEELNAIIGSVRELYPHKKLTAIFQPHLFTRTRDFAEGFAQSLSKPDEIILMEIYPARELPIPGITSGWLLEKINAAHKSLLTEEEILLKLRNEKAELLLILGAGDIDRLVPKIREVYS